jgi:hypothetical protein
MADTPPMQYQPHREGCPIGGRPQFLQVALDCISIMLVRQSEPQRQPADMGVNHQAWLAEYVTEQYVSGFAADPWQG